MRAAVHCPSVMRLPVQTRGTDAPPIRRTLAGTLVLAGLLAVALVAVSAPAVVASAFLALAAAWAGVRGVRRYRRRLGRQSRQVCIPHTNVCVDA